MTSNGLPHQARRPADRQLARLLLKCMQKLLKALAMPREVDKLVTINLPSVLAQLHDLSLLAPPSPTGDVSFTLDLMKATEEVLRVLVDPPRGMQAQCSPRRPLFSPQILRVLADGRGAAALKAAIPRGAEGGGVATWIDQRVADAPNTALRMVPPPAAPPPAAPPPAAPLAAPLPSMPLEPMQLGAAFDQAAPSPAPKAGVPTTAPMTVEPSAPTTAPMTVAPSPRQRSSSAPAPLKSPSAGAAPSAAAAPVAKSPRSVAKSPRPMAIKPATAASASTAAVESVAVAARAKLEAMKRKYNITTAHSAAAPVASAATAAAAATATGAAATAAVAPVGAGMGDHSTRGVNAEAGMCESVVEGAPAAGVAGTTSPSLNVAALKSRLARLRARP